MLSVLWPVSFMATDRGTLARSRVSHGATPKIVKSSPGRPGLLARLLPPRRRKNVVQARSFADMLEQTIRRYQNHAIEAAQVIEELIALAKDMRKAKVLGDETLRTIAQELVRTVRANVCDRLDATRERSRSAARAGEADP